METTGVWTLPPGKNIGYLEQHYQNLARDKTAFDMISSLLPNISYTGIRKHLNDFLFRKMKK